MTRYAAPGFLYESDQIFLDDTVLLYTADRHHLRYPITQTCYTRRYVNEEYPYPEDMFDENLFFHLLRTGNIINDIRGNNPHLKISYYALEVIWLLHDIGELAFDHDHSAVDSKNWKAIAEWATAEEIIKDSGDSDQDVEYKIRCYRKYIDAKRYLKDTAIKPPENIDEEYMAGLLFAVVDMYDGNMFFHNRLHEWIKEGNTFPEDHPGLKYAFIQRERTLRQIGMMPESLEKELLIQIVNSQLDYIKSVWINDLHLMPAVVRNEMIDAGVYLEEPVRQ